MKYVHPCAGCDKEDNCKLDYADPGCDNAPPETLDAASPGPWTVETRDAWTEIVRDADGVIVCKTSCEDASNGHRTNARLLVRAVNSHDALVEALEAFLEAWDKSHQLEKTDQALALARAALENARKGE